MSGQDRQHILDLKAYALGNATSTSMAGQHRAAKREWQHKGRKWQHGKDSMSLNSRLNGLWRPGQERLELVSWGTTLGQEWKNLPTTPGTGDLGGMRHTSIAHYFYGAPKKSLHKPGVIYGNILFHISYGLNCYLQLLFLKFLSKTHLNF